VEQAHLEKFLAGGGEEKQARADVIKQVRTLLDALKAFRVSTSATYVEEGVLVTHREMVVRDE
jgi:hypothetical protein